MFKKMIELWKAVKIARLFVQERMRQIFDEGWTAEHDQEHWRGELAKAAAFYVWPTENTSLFPRQWDWGWNKYQKHPIKKRLIIAGALIMAEMARYENNPESQVDYKASDYFNTKI